MYEAETGFYYLNSRYYDPEVGRFISSDSTDVLTATPTALTDKNLYVYCDNNPVMRSDLGGNMWELAVVGGGTLALGSSVSVGAIGSSIIAAFGAITPVGWAVIGTVAVIGVASLAIKYTKIESESESDTKNRINSPIGRRNDYNSRKKAKEAKEAGKVTNNTYGDNKT